MKSKLVIKILLGLGVLLACVTYPISGNSQSRGPQTSGAHPRNLKTHKQSQITRKVNGVLFKSVDAVPVFLNDKAIKRTHPHTVWYKVGESLNGSDLSLVQSSNQRENIVVPNKDLDNGVNDNYNVALPHTNNLRKQTLLFLGDSITKGYNGSYTYKHASFPLWVHRYLQTRVHKEGHIRSSITGHSFNDLFTILPTVNFKSANAIIIEYGTNDYRHSAASLTQVEAKLTRAIKIIRSKNPKAKIYGIIPLPRFDFTNMATAKGMGGYTFPELQSGITDTYHSLGIPTYNIAKVHPEFINNNNFYQKYYDQRVHPTSQTYQQFGYYLSCWLEQQLN